MVKPFVSELAGFVAAETATYRRAECAVFRKTASAPSSRVADPDDVTYGMTTPTITALTQAKPLIDMRNVMRTQQPLGIVHPSSALYMRHDRAVSHRASPRLAVSRSSAPTRGSCSARSRRPISSS